MAKIELVIPKHANLSAKVLEKAYKALAGKKLDVEVPDALLDPSDKIMSADDVEKIVLKVLGSVAPDLAKAGMSLKGQKLHTLASYEFFMEAKPKPVNLTMVLKPPRVADMSKRDISKFKTKAKGNQWTYDPLWRKKPDSSLFAIRRCKLDITLNVERVPAMKQLDLVGKAAETEANAGRLQLAEMLEEFEKKLAEDMKKAVANPKVVADVEKRAKLLDKKIKMEAGTLRDRILKKAEAALAQLVPALPILKLAQLSVDIVLFYSNVELSPEVEIMAEADERKPAENVEASSKASDVAKSLAEDVRGERDRRRQAYLALEKLVETRVKLAAKTEGTPDGDGDAKDARDMPTPKSHRDDSVSATTACESDLDKIEEMIKKLDELANAVRKMDKKARDEKILTDADKKANDLLLQKKAVLEANISGPKKYYESMLATVKAVRGLAAPKGISAPVDPIKKLMAKMDKSSGQIESQAKLVNTTLVELAKRYEKTKV